ncbi:uncharacterized protein CG5098 [Thrips palmi]|uniref:Uncharacterized protein CG5098 n=1 Tax=Thrips palmi TaxID=161013 RepID=A0A6P8ZUU9_THRPL|nr:uncharacterized protein CG5098 [Thrips palmi]XP_034248725.1 uncharacterized protein CG5098 [Thrips palmi]XP_034248726.1 uncharacterized protein CG5098 [Thrips palmi]XP_034248727.1 uncharacterized protein CG5098 [Thrips palmi]
MSGQFPTHQTGAPVTMNSFSSWNQQGKSVPTGTSQTVHGMLPQSEMQPLNPAAASPPKPSKFVNTAQNGAGSHVPSSVISQNSQSSLADNLRQNFIMNFNMNQAPGQPSKFQSNETTMMPTIVSSGSMDLSRAPRTLEGEHSKVVPSVVQQTNQNQSVISSAIVSSAFNGEIHSRTSSVIANSAPSLSNKGSDVSVPTTLTNIKQDIIQKDSNIAANPNPKVEGSADLALKMEPRIVKAEQKLPPPYSIVREPPLKKLKEEPVGYVNSSVIMNSSNHEKVRDTNASSSGKIGGQGSQGNIGTPASTSAAKQDALDVESQLEALFAGIADTGNTSKESKPPVISNSLQGTPNVAAVLESKGSSSKKGKGKQNGVAGASSTETTPKKKRKKKPAKDKPWDDSKNKKLKKGGSSKGKYVKEASCDSGSNASSSRVRGPVVHIEGTKDAPISLVVVNAPARQDDEENDSKKKSASTRIRKIHLTEGKLSSTGLCSNSLVTRYESHSSDPRWVCVFCKKGCHIDGLGDLFGPYLIHHDAELERSLDLDADLDRRGGDKKDKKNKRIGLGQTGVLGLLPIPPLPGEQSQFMVYFHEYCAVWSPSINLIGSRLAGVQEAVWVAVRTKCSQCLSDGANIGCIHHGCSLQVHFPCARDGSWSLDEDTFTSACHIHKKVGQTPILPVATIL